MATPPYYTTHVLTQQPTRTAVVLGITSLHTTYMHWRVPCRVPCRRSCRRPPVGLHCLCTCVRTLTVSSEVRSTVAVVCARAVPAAKLCSRMSNSAAWLVMHEYPQCSACDAERRTAQSAPVDQNALRVSTCSPITDGCLVPNLLATSRPGSCCHCDSDGGSASADASFACFSASRRAAYRS